jgi:hypothetical protein
MYRRWRMFFGGIGLGGVLVWVGAISRAQHEDLTYGLIAYWNFDEGRGLDIHDLSGHSHHGKLRGPAWWTRGYVRGGVQLNGFDDAVEISPSSLLMQEQAVTIAAWIYILQEGRQVNSWLGERYRLVIGWSLDARFVAFLDGQWRSSGSFVIPANTWVHIVGTYDAQARTLRLYVNGELKKEQALSGLNSYKIVQAPLPLRFTQDSRQPPENRIWKIDEVRIYSRALSPSEVQTLSQFIPPRFNPSDPPSRHTEGP